MEETDIVNIQCISILKGILGRGEDTEIPLELGFVDWEQKTIQMSKVRTMHFREGIACL